MVWIELTRSGANMAIMVATAQPEFFELKSCTVTIKSVMKSKSAMYSRRYSISTIRLQFDESVLTVLVCLLIFYWTSILIG